MSRKANKPIAIPQGVTVTVNDRVVSVKGPKGELHETLHPVVSVAVAPEGVVLTIPDTTIKSDRAIWGTFGALIQNMIKGVTEGYSVQLEITGVGYQFDTSGQKLTIKAGFSHPVIMAIPADIKITQAKNVITLSSANKQLVGQVAADIRKVRKPEPYKGKGIKYVGEVIIRKQGKQAGTSS